jgi:ABC-type glutathione transport system ATPase component
MPDLAIRVENPCPDRKRRMSKLYPELSARAGHIGAPSGRQQRHDTHSAALRTGLRDALTSRLRRAHQSTNSQATSSDDLWALKDVSCEACPEVRRRIKRGKEVVGIIGRNGAGKSTLLHILSRITGPTSGQTICAKVRFAVS